MLKTSGKKNAKLEFTFSAHQPNYLPYLGFFDKIFRSDVFVIADNAQFVRQDWQNRNRIKGPSGVFWLTVPIKHVRHFQKINEARIFNSPQNDWRQKHWLALKHNYSKAPFWKKYSNFFKQTYKQKWIYLIDLNMHLIKGIMHFLGINNRLLFASSLESSGKSTDLILAWCKAFGANTYFSGTMGKKYLKLERFKSDKIKVVFQNFQHPKYQQLWDNSFQHNLSVVDYLFCTGKKWNPTNQNINIEIDNLEGK